MRNTPVCCLGNGILYSRKIWRALYLANWLFRSSGDFKFGDSPTARDAFNRRTPRLIDGCERLLELQLTSVNEIEVLKSKKSMDVFVESCVRGHHIYKQVWTPCIVGKELTHL